MADFQLMCCNNVYTGFVFKNSQKLNNYSVLPSGMLGDMSWRALLTWDVLETGERRRCCEPLFLINFVDSEKARLCPQVTSTGTIKPCISQFSFLVPLIFTKVLNKTARIYKLLRFLHGFINNFSWLWEMWDLPLEYLRPDSSLAPRKVPGQLLSSLQGLSFMPEKWQSYPFHFSWPLLSEFALSKSAAYVRRCFTPMLL